MAKKKKLGRPRKRGRPPTHGAYITSLKDQYLKTTPQVRRFLESTRFGLIRDVAGSEENLSEQQRIMIDRVISRLLILRVIEGWIVRDGIWDRKALLGKPSTLKLESCLSDSYLAYSNSIDRALKSLGLEKKAIDAGFDYIEQFDKNKEKQGKGKG